jgi:hypothetical protein
MKKLIVSLVLCLSFIFSYSQDTLKYDIVEITWLDHYANDAWIDIEEIEINNTICTSVGYFVKENTNYIVLARTITNDGLCDGLMFIIKDVIIEIKYLKL